MLVWLTLLFYDFCGFRSVAVNSVYKLQFFYIYLQLNIAFSEALRRPQLRVLRMNAALQWVENLTVHVRGPVIRLKRYDSI